jgi:hypothetical protein
MAGNVWEWCLNRYDKPMETDPGSDAGRVVRGGSWNYGSIVGSRVVPTATATLPASAASFSAFGCCVSPPSFETLATAALISDFLLRWFSEAPRAALTGA